MCYRQKAKLTTHPLVPEFCKKISLDIRECHRVAINDSKKKKLENPRKAFKSRDCDAKIRIELNFYFSDREGKNKIGHFYEISFPKISAHSHDLDCNNILTAPVHPSVEKKFRELCHNTLS